MSAAVAKAEELVALTDKLAAQIEQDVQTLKRNRPSALAQQEHSRATLLLTFGKSAAEFKNAAAMAQLPAPTKLRLKSATERLHKALKDQNRLLARFRHVTEGLVKSIADTVAARSTPSAYAKSGAFAKPTAGYASAMTLNQAV